MIILVVAFSGYQQIQGIWEESGESLDATYEEVKGGLFDWYKSATDTTKELKETLNVKIDAATERYESLKNEVESITSRVNEKREQLDQTLKEIEEAKKALDELLEKEEEIEDGQSDENYSSEVRGEATVE